jgi:hypothetical protein
VGAAVGGTAVGTAVGGTAVGGTAVAVGVAVLQAAKTTLTKMSKVRKVNDKLRFMFSSPFEK